MNVTKKTYPLQEHETDKLFNSYSLGAAMNTGLSEAQMKDFIAVLASRVDNQVAENANEILGQVLSRKAPSSAE